MANVDERTKAGAKKACCLVSEMLEEMGLDALKAREIRRQTLLGLMTFCQWQIARIDANTAAAGRSSRRARPSGSGATRGRRVKVV